MIFGQQIELKIKSPDGKYKIFKSGDSYDLKNSFHIEFTVEFGKSNGIDIKLFNPSRETGDMCLPINKIPAEIFLYAGYQKGTDVRLIASGDIVSSNYKAVGVDRILEIKSAFKVKELYQTVTNKTFYNTPIYLIIESMLKEAGINHYDLKVLNNQVLEQYTASGNLKTNLDKLCKIGGVVHYPKLGAIIIEPENEKKSRTSKRIYLHRKSGMIGSPEKKGVNLSVKCLLNPSIQKGEFVRIKYIDHAKNKELEDDYIVQSGKHTANLSGSFYTEFECRKA